MRGGEPRDHLAAQPARAQADAIADDGDEQIGDRDAPVARRGRAAQKRDLARAEHGPQEHVAHPALGQVDDLGEDRVRPQRRLVGQVAAHRLLQLRKRMTEPAQQRRAGRAGGTLEVDAEVPAVDRVVRCGGERDLDRQRVRKRRRILLRERLDVGVVEDELEGIPVPLQPAEQMAEAGRRRWQGCRPAAETRSPRAAARARPPPRRSRRSRCRTRRRAPAPAGSPAPPIARRTDRGRPREGRPARAWPAGAGAGSRATPRRSRPDRAPGPAPA